MPKLFPVMRGRGLGDGPGWLTVAIACLALGINAISIITLIDGRREARHEAEAGCRNLVNAVAGDLARNLELIDSSLQTVAHNLAQAEAEMPLPTWHRLLFERAPRGRQFGVIAVVGPEGSVVFDSSGEPRRPVSFADFNFFRMHASGRANGLYISTPRESPIDGRLHVHVSRPLRDGDGGFAGVVLGSLELEYILERFRRIELGSQGVMSVARTDRTLLVRYPEQPGAAEPDLSRSALFEHFAQAPAGTFEGVSTIDRVPRLYAYSQVEHYPVVMTVALASADVYAAWRSKAWVLGLSTVIMDLALVAVVVLLHRDARRRRRAHLATLRNEALFRGAMHGAGIGMALMTPEGSIIHVNPALCRMLGYAEDELVGRSLGDFSDADQSPLGAAVAPRLLSGDIDFHEVERRYVRKDCSRFWALLSLSVDRGRADAPLVLIAQLQDVDARKRAEQARDGLLRRLHAATDALHDEKELLQITLNSIADAVIATDRQGRIRFMNPAAEIAIGVRLGEVREQPLAELLRLFDAETDAARPDLVAGWLAGASAVQESARMQDRSGELHDIQASVTSLRALSGDVLGTVLVFQDVTASRALQRELSHHVSHDALTGLHNRTMFQLRLETALREARERHSQHVLAFLDLDQFKIINDTAGHSAGDALLRQVAALLLEQVRPGDTVARLGGDEFGLILCNRSLEQGCQMMEALIEVLAARQFPWEGRLYDVGASAGVTGIDTQSESPLKLMGQADVACHAAKSGGRRRVSVYRHDQSDAQDLHRELVVAAEMRRALSENRFVLYGQRIASCSDPEHSRYELLLRMVTPEGKVVQPAEFIPAAERYDLMAAIDRWVFDTCLRGYAARIAAVPGLHLHLNLSASSLNDRAFRPYVTQLLDACGLDLSTLVFEITETALVSNMSSATEIISALRLRGCKVALDDFGIGLSSFSYLRTFPVDLVKIDGSFICNMAHSAVDRRIAGSIHQIAHVLEAQTIAESVEDWNTFEAVRSLEIDFAQGFGLHRPKPFDEILAMHGA